MLSTLRKSKSALMALALGILFTANANAHKHAVDDLLDMPHPMRVMQTPAWQQRLTPVQKQDIQQLRSEIQPKYLLLMSEAAPLQEALRKSLLGYESAGPADEERLKTLAELRVRMTLVQAHAFAQLKKILGPEEWQLMLKDLQH